MNKNNLIRFVQSFLILPIVTMSIPFGDTPKYEPTIVSDSQTVLSKLNIEASGLLAFNQVVDQKAKELEAKANAIDAYFREHNMPLESMGMKMIQEAEKNGLEWNLLPAISVIETTGGQHMCKNPKAQNNPWGWGSCKIGFNSIEESIEVVAMNLGGNDPDTERHYSGKTTEEILKKYNPPSIVHNYADKVMKVMKEIEGNLIEMPAKKINV